MHCYFSRPTRLHQVQDFAESLQHSLVMIRLFYCSNLPYKEPADLQAPHSITTQPHHVHNTSYSPALWPNSMHAWW